MTIADDTRAQVRVRGPREVLSVIPYLLGFTPSESVLVLCVGADGSVGLTARSDLTDLTDLTGGDVVGQVAGMVARRAVEGGTAAAWVVLYTDTTPAPQRVIAAVDAFTGALTGAGITTVSTWRVGAGRYWSMDCADEDCCPPDGRPVTDLVATEPVAELVLAGRSPARTRADAYKIGPADQDARASACHAMRAWEQAKALQPDWRAWSLASWSQATTATVPGPVRLGELAAALADTRVRDAVLLTLIGAPDAATATAHGEEADAAVGKAIAALTEPAHARRPDIDCLQGAVRLLEAIVAHTTGQATAPALTLLGLLAWWTGDGSRATARIRDAITADPTYRLARLMEAALAAGLPPGWVRARKRA